MSEPYVNFFGGSPLNRLSWLRPSHTFLNAITASPSARWTLFNAGNPLVASSSNTLAKLTTPVVKSLLGPTPYFGQGQQPGTLVHIQEGEKHSPLEAARHRGPPIVFLGLHEPEDVNGALPNTDFADPVKAVSNIKGTLYFALDVSDLIEHEDGKKQVESVLNDASAGGDELVWAESRAVIATSDQFDSALFAIARSLTDWNLRNKFCAGCGSPVYSMWGGWKLSCSSLLPWNAERNVGKKPCITKTGLHNFTHPRTDPVVIMVAIDETGEKALLGRSFRYKGKMYSALAGFIEPAESFEDAVVREMWEEAGVKVTDTQYHSAQPWPYPANLMVGYYARADSSQPIRTDLDNELADARWFTREEILETLRLAPNFQVSDVGKEDQRGIRFSIPPRTAIAGVLIRDWAERRIQFDDLTKQVKGNL